MAIDHNLDDGFVVVCNKKMHKSSSTGPKNIVGPQDPLVPSTTTGSNNFFSQYTPHNNSLNIVQNIEIPQNEVVEGSLSKTSS